MQLLHRQLSYKHSRLSLITSSYLSSGPKDNNFKSFSVSYTLGSNRTDWIYTKERFLLCGRECLLFAHKSLKPPIPTAVLTASTSSSTKSRANRRYDSTSTGNNRPQSRVKWNSTDRSLLNFPARFRRIIKHSLMLVPQWLLRPSK